MLHGTILSEYVVEGWFGWLVFIMVMCKIIKGKSGRLCCFCYASAIAHQKCSNFTVASPRRQRARKTLVIITFLMSPALYVSNVCGDQVCLKLV